MKKIKVIIPLLFTFILLATSVSADYLDNNTPGLVARYKIDTGSGTTLFDSKGNFDLTLENADQWNAVNLAPITGNTYSMDTLVQNRFAVAAIDPTGDSNEGTIAGWHRSVTNNGVGASINLWAGGIPTDAFSIRNKNRIPWCYIFGGGNCQLAGTSAYPANTWVHLACVLNNSGNTLELYYNGVLNNSMACTQDIVPITDTVLGQWWPDGSTTEGFLGQLDEVIIYDRPIGPAEIFALYEATEPPILDTLNISNASIANNTQYDTPTLNFNLTANASLVFNCSFILNDNVNETQTGLGAGANVLSNFTKTFADGTWNYSINCTTVDDTEITSTNTFYIDITDPTITDSFINNSVFFLNNLSFQVNFSDNLILSSYNISIDGTNIQGNNSIGTTPFQINFTYDTSSLFIGSHNLSLRIADGHTATELGGDYKIKDGFFNDYLRYEFWDGGYVRIEGNPDSWFDEFTTERKIDKYIFSYEPADKDKTFYTFNVVSDMEIYFVDAPSTKYKQWLIMGNHWMDFYPYEPEFRRINDKEVEVTIYTTDDIMEFNSIGDLNIVYQNYTFITTNATITYSDPVSEKQFQTMTFNISKPTGIVSTTASLLYNNATQSVTKQDNTDHDFYTSSFFTPAINVSSLLVNFSWIYNITSIANSEAGNITNTQTITQIGIDNCSVYTMRAINITVRRDDTNALQNTNIGAYFEVWVTNETNFRPFNLSWNNISQGGVCINPNSSTYRSYAQFEFGGGVAGFNEETHYLINYTLSNQTALLNFYLTPNGTLVSFTVTDENDNAVQGVFINILRYDFDTHTHVTTEILETDEQGGALGTIVLNTQWYKFLLVLDNVIVLETDPVKITSTTRNFRINLQTNFFDFFEIFDNTATSLSFTNSTLNFAYTFLNSAGVSVEACLNVREGGYGSGTFVNKTCVTSSGGTILINIGPSVTGKAFIAVGTIGINPHEVTNVLSVDFDEGYKKWGKDGVFVSFLVRLGLSLIGIWSPMVAILFLVFADVGMVYMGLYHMDWTTMIFYVILAGIAIYRVNRKR